MSDHEHVWIALNQLHTRVAGEIAGALKAAGLPPLDWYDVLWELEKAKDGLTQKQIEARILLPQYGLSRLVARLEADGLLERRENPEDRRGHLLRITKAGRNLRRRMWEVYNPSLEKALSALPSGQARRTLAAQLRKLAD